MTNNILFKAFAFAGLCGLVLLSSGCSEEPAGEPKLPYFSPSSGEGSIAPGSSVVEEPGSPAPTTPAGSQGDTGSSDPAPASSTPETSSDDPSDDTPPDQGDSTSGAAPTAGDCTYSGFAAHEERAVAQAGGDGRVNVRYIASKGPEALKDILDATSYAAWGGPTLPGEYSLAGVNYKDCGLCLLIKQGCADSSGAQCAKRFYASEGTLEVTAIGSGGQSFAAVMRDVVFKEVTIGSDYTSTEVPGGERWCMNGYSFAQVLNAPATIHPENAPGTVTVDGPESEPEPEPEPEPESPAPASSGEGSGLGVLGKGTHLRSSLTVEVFATERHGLVSPKDIALNPEKSGEFWVVNQGDSSMSILLGAEAEQAWTCDPRYYGAGDGCDCGCGVMDSDCANNSASSCQYGCEGLRVNPQDPTQCLVGAAPTGFSASTRFFKRKNTDGSGTHFLARPVGLAFGAHQRLATAHEENRVTQPSTPRDFMGPTLWTSNLQEFEGGHPSHYDMLHNSPSAAGIAWQSAGIYWVFDGAHNSLTRYNFNRDHGPGGTDHSDGVVHRFVDGQMSYVPGVVSQMAYDSTTGLLYAADTGRNRIVALDTNSGRQGGAITPNYDGTVQRYVHGAALSTVINGASVGLVRPAGLRLVGDTLFVTDNATSRVYGFSKDGELLDWVDMELASGSLAGLTFDSAGRMYLVDTSANQILRVTAK